MKAVLHVYASHVSPVHHLSAVLQMKTIFWNYDGDAWVAFQPKGADRKQKTDREKMEKRAPQEKEKYQPSYETTILTEVSSCLGFQTLGLNCECI